ncbi:Uncharacterised protein [Acinetobacter haemolyticus]|nr:Uncharacterised protein [Acinetobacter haemolyticus]
MGNQDNRIDIEIDAPDFLLFIEIKINAGEGEKQLQRYFEIAQAKAWRKDWLIVYLTKDGKLPKQYQDSDRYRGVSWLEVSKILNQYANGKDDNRGAWLVRQFADHVKGF